MTNDTQGRQRPSIARMGLAAIAIAGALLITTPVAASAAQPPTATPATPAALPTAQDTLAGLKAAVTARIDLRLAALNKDLVTITNARALTDAHRRELAATVEEAVTGLTALKEKVAGETTLAALRADAAAMVNDYRVFLLIGPQVRLTIVGDAEAIAIDRAEQAHARLTDLVADKAAGGTDTSAAEQDLADMKAAIDSARANVDGQVATVLAIEPGPDGAAIESALAGVRRHLGAARGDLRLAVAEGRAVVAFLRSN